MAMKKSLQTENRDSTQSLYLTYEAKTNLFNLKCLGILSLMAALSVLLNEIGLFKVDRLVIMTFLSVTVLFYFIHDYILKKTPSCIKQPYFKLMVIFCSFFGIMVVCVVLSLHVIILRRGGQKLYQRSDQL